ncbi:MAG: hypothetical protein Tsb0020_01590 [Haliangiales bacterium]
MNKKIRIAVAAILGIATTATLASADQKVYTGSGCVAKGTSQSVFSYSFGRVFNASAAEQTAYCPVVLDAYTIGSTGNWIYLWDRHYDENISCWLRTQSSTTVSYYYSGVSTSGSSSTPTKHEFSSASYISEGHRYISCDVPGTYYGNQSGIVSYAVNEW